VNRYAMRSRVGIVARAALLVALASLVGGCPAPGYNPSGRAEVERVLVLPLNVVAAMPRELAHGARDVDRILLDYLAERGKAVEAMKYDDSVAAWRAGESECRAHEKKGCDRFADVAPFVARQLRATHAYDALLVPYLLLRGARTNGEMATFDGVKRPLDAGLPANGPLWLAQNRIRAASLKVFGFHPDGKRMFAGIGGIDLVDRIELSREQYPPPYTVPYTVEVREDVLRDPATIREGVEIALRDLVTPSHARR
jgi:hypothetical protein